VPLQQAHRAHQLAARRHVIEVGEHHDEATLAGEAAMRSAAASGLDSSAAAVMVSRQLRIR
jgi:hypothetical protein